MSFKILKAIVITPLAIVLSPFWLFANITMSENWAEFWDGWKFWFKNW